MDNLEIKPIGTVECLEPENWCVISDISTAWMRTNVDESHILRTRVCAASIGIVWGKSNDVSVPVYDYRKGDIFAYGAAVQDVLMRQRVNIAEILMAGARSFRMLQAVIPTPADMEATADFSEAAEDDKT